MRLKVIGLPNFARARMSLSGTTYNSARAMNFNLIIFNVYVVELFTSRNQIYLISCNHNIGMDVLVGR